MTHPDASDPASAAIEVVDSVLRGWPLPDVADDDDKEGRGRVLIVAGSREIPGAAVLAALAALRSGAGKLLLASAASVAQGIALAVPEARVMSLAESASGGIEPAAVAQLAPLAQRTDAVLIGPGLLGGDASCRFVHRLLPVFRDVPVLLDALAMDVIGLQHRFDQPVVLTPHAGEMAHLSGRSKETIRSDPQGVSREAAMRWNAVVALKGAVTWIAAPDGSLWRHRGGSIGLATSGSGDALAGIIVGLLARGATPVQATLWGVVLHARAGERLARRLGALGFLARDISAEVPALLEALG